MSKDKKLSPLAAEIVAGLNEFCDVLEAGERAEKRYTIRTVTLDLSPRQFGPDDLKRVRVTILKASQPLLAKFLGVSVKTLRSWEQGLQPIPAMACRYLDDIVECPELWRRRVKLSNNPSEAAGTN